MMDSLGRPLHCQGLAKLRHKDRRRGNGRFVRRGHKLSGKTQRGPVDQIRRRETSLVPNRGPDAEEDNREMSHPIRGSEPGTEALLKDSVDTPVSYTHLTLPTILLV